MKNNKIYYELIPVIYGGIIIVSVKRVLAQHGAVKAETIVVKHIGNISM